MLKIKDSELELSLGLLDGQNKTFGEVTLGCGKFYYLSRLSDILQSVRKTISRLIRNENIVSKSLSSREKGMSEILRCYPELKSVNERGKEVTEYSNKYWLMLSEDETLATYPEKDLQK